MQTLTLFMHSSLDGFISDTNGDIGMFDVEPEMLTESIEVFGGVDTIVYGRGIYTTWDAYWGGMDLEDPEVPPPVAEFARAYRRPHKRVVSSTLDDLGPNASRIDGDIVAQIREAKAQPGRGMLLVAGPDLVATLLAAKLLDRILLNIYPIVLGDGISLFSGLPEPMRFTPVSAFVYPSGVVAQRLAVSYEPFAAEPMLVPPARA